MKTIQAPSPPPFDSAKVDSIRQAILEGRFKASADAIADSLLAGAIRRATLQSSRRRGNGCTQNLA